MGTEHKRVKEKNAEKHTQNLSKQKNGEKKFCIEILRFGRKFRKKN